MSFQSPLAVHDVGCWHCFLLHTRNCFVGNSSLDQTVPFASRYLKVMNIVCIFFVQGSQKFLIGWTASGRTNLAVLSFSFALAVLPFEFEATSQFSSNGKMVAVYTLFAASALGCFLSLRRAPNLDDSLLC